MAMLTCCGCGQGITMCVACDSAWNCPTPVCLNCAEKGLRERAAVEAALRDVRVRDRLWNIWHRVTWAVLTRFGRRAFEPPRRDIERGANPSEVV